MIKPQKYQAEVISKRDLNSKVVHITFRLNTPDYIEFKAGQRGLFNIGVKFNNYSICSSVYDHKNISTCVDTTPNGAGSKWIRGAKVGDKIEIIAPLGSFFLTDSLKPKIFLATGSGISPINSMIDQLLTDGFIGDIYLFFGERFQSDIFWKSEYENMEKKHKNFHYIIVLSKPDNSWLGKVGYVQNVMDQKLFQSRKYNPLDFEDYICGNGKMITDSINLLTKYQVNSQDIHFEKFYGI